MSSARPASVTILASAAFAFSYTSCAAASAQPLIPVRFQCIGHQAIIGIDLEEAALGKIRFVARTLYVLSSQPVRFLVAVREFLLHSERDFVGQRRHCRDDDVADCRVECAAIHRLTQTAFASLQRAPAAPVGRYALIVMRMVADRHAFTAGSADHKSLQQCRALACPSTPPLGAPGDRIALHALEVRPILFLGNVTRMHDVQQDPLLAGHQTRAYLAIGQPTLFGATEDEGAGVAWVVYDLPLTAVKQLGPDQLALVHPRRAIGTGTAVPSPGTP